jgi:hypothetical protein
LYVETQRHRGTEEKVEIFQAPFAYLCSLCAFALSEDSVAKVFLIQRYRAHSVTQDGILLGAGVVNPVHKKLHTELQRL